MSYLFHLAWPESEYSKLQPGAIIALIVVAKTEMDARKLAMKECNESCGGKVFCKWVCYDQTECVRLGTPHEHEPRVVIRHEVILQNGGV